jgi:hypothetical protein
VYRRYIRVDCKQSASCNFTCAVALINHLQNVHGNMVWVNSQSSLVCELASISGVGFQITSKVETKYYFLKKKTFYSTSKIPLKTGNTELTVLFIKQNSAIQVSLSHGIMHLAFLWDLFRKAISNLLPKSETNGHFINTERGEAVLGITQDLPVGYKSCPVLTLTEQMCQAWRYSYRNKRLYMYLLLTCLWHVHHTLSETLL